MITFIVILLVVAIVICMYALKLSLNTSRLIAGILAGINIMFYAFYASLYTNSWHDPRIRCDNQGLLFLLLLLFWSPFIIAFASSAVWWIIREFKEADIMHAILKVLVPCVLVAMSVGAITLATFWNPNAYCYVMDRKYEAGLLDDEEEEEWDDIDRVATEDSIYVEGAEAVPDSIINP